MRSGGLVSDNPGMREDLLGAVSLGGVDDQEFADEVLGGVGDVVPVGRWKLELGVEDLLE